MSATAPSGAAAAPGPYVPAGWGPPRDGATGGGWNPWALVWSVPKPLLIAAMVLAFIAFWPIGLAVLFFMLGTGRIGSRWGRRHGRHGPGPSWTGDQPGNGGGCGWRGGWRRDEAPPSSGNKAFDEYRLDTLRRLEEEQREFGAFLERLRFAKDKAEFDEFMAERRRPRPDAPPPAADAAPQES
jgi:hypothetical protein